MASASDLGTGGDTVHLPTYVQFDLLYSERLSRAALFVKWIAAIPPSVVLIFYSISVSIVSFFAFWIILISGRYPLWMFEHVESYLRYSFRHLAYFPLLLTGDPKHVTYTVDRPERHSRLALILRLPISPIAEILVLGATLALFLIALPAWWVILFTGKYPQAFFSLSRSLLQWVALVSAWQWGLRDEWALFNAPGRTWAVIGVSSIITAGLISFGVTAPILAEQKTFSQAEDAIESLVLGRTSHYVYEGLLSVKGRQSGSFFEGNGPESIPPEWRRQSAAGSMTMEEAGKIVYRQGLDLIWVAGDLIYDDGANGAFIAALVKTSSRWEVKELTMARAP